MVPLGAAIPGLTARGEDIDGLGKAADRPPCGAVVKKLGKLRCCVGTACGKLG